VRELKNMVQGISVTCPDSISLPSHLPFAACLPQKGDTGKVLTNVNFDGRTYKEIVKDMEGLVLQAALRKYGNIANIAKELQVDRSTIFRKMKELEKKGMKFE
jgi:transcriptional regulator with PAS, ATPase and Fis domain